MGYFTFTLANKEPIETQYGYASSCKLGYGSKGYIAIPKECKNLYLDALTNNYGTFIKENFYDGYGIFGSHDIYDVIVEINKGYLVDAINKITEQKYQDERNSESYRNSILEKGKFYSKLAKMYESGISEEQIQEEFGKTHYKNNPDLWKEWKRYLGIYLSCYKNDNELLHFPLKVTSSSRVRYEDLPASDSTQ